jgi:hypothetical protein
MTALALFALGKFTAKQVIDDRASPGPALIALCRQVSQDALQFLQVLDLASYRLEMLQGD